MGWTRTARAKPGRIAWDDIEALPLYAAAVLVVVAIIHGLTDASWVLQGMTAKVAVIVGGLGLRSAWLGMHELPTE